MAYKYAPREQSTTDLMAMNASSQYAFSGRKASNLNREEALNAYNRRAQSIGAGATADPAAAPSSGKGGNVMFNDTSATALEEQPDETAKSTKEWEKHDEQRMRHTHIHAYLIEDIFMVI